jgi:glycosyltransferase involved in cell wall biosynthesis
MSALRRLRILEIATSGTVGTPDMGPVSTTICALANGFARVGHSVTVADRPCAKPRSSLDQRTEVVTVPVSSGRLRRLAALWAIGSRLNVWCDALRYLWSLRRRLRLETFDVVHVHDEALAFLLSLVIPGRFYYTSHTSVWALKRAQSEKLSLGERLDAAIESFAIRNSHATIALSDYLAAQVPSALIETIAHGIETQSWQPLERATSRSALGMNGDDFVAVFVGRIHPQKGLDVLIEAVRKIAPDRPRFHLFVIGSHGGHYSARESPSVYAIDLLRRAVGAPIRFVGFLEHHSTELRQYLSAADVAVVPSRYEPFGYVALEALAMSLPVIASRTGGLAQTITDDVGLLVPPGDASALAFAMGTAHDEPLRLRAWSEKCRARVEYGYSRDQSVARHLALFMKDAQEPALHLETSP